MRALVGLGTALSLAAVHPTANAIAGTRAASCTPVATLVTPAAFSKYPADPVWHGPWHQPDVRGGVAHLYRTVVRSEAVGPPDFAGHFKVVRHGCGAGMTCPLFFDLKSGRVILVPALESVEQPYEIGNVRGIDDLRLVYRLDSRLLVAVGTRNERDRLTGATLFEMRKNRLRLVRFIPNKALCLDGPGLGRAS